MTESDRQRRIREIMSEDGVDEEEAVWLLDLVDGAWRGDIGGPDGLTDEERCVYGLEPWPVPVREPTVSRS